MKKLDRQHNRAAGSGLAAGAGVARRMGVFFAGSAAGKNFMDAGVFTPCADWFRLLETVNLTASDAACGDVTLLSPACSSFDQFRNQTFRGEVSRNVAGRLADATGGMVAAANHNTQAAGKSGPAETGGFGKKDLSLHRGFLRQNPGAKTQPNPTSPERTLNSANKL